MKKLKLQQVDWAQIERFFASAEKKLASARKILAFDEEASLQQAYEAMLKASLGLMFSYGLRARSQPGHHIAIIDFVRARIDSKHAGLVTVNLEPLSLGLLSFRQFGARKHPINVRLSPTIALNLSLNQKSLHAIELHNIQPVSRPSLMLHTIQMIFHGLLGK